MWVTKRRTKQAKKRHKKNLLRSSIFGGAFLICSLIGVVVYRTFFIQPPLLIPIMEASGSTSYSSEDPGIAQLKQLLEQKAIAYSGIQKMPEGNYLVKLKENGEVIIAGTRNISSQIASLQLIISRLTMEGKRFTRLDMRFDKPVISQ